MTNAEIKEHAVREAGARVFRWVRKKLLEAYDRGVGLEHFDEDARLVDTGDPEADRVRRRIRDEANAAYCSALEGLILSIEVQIRDLGGEIGYVDGQLY